MTYELNLKKISSPILVKVRADSPRKSIRRLTVAASNAVSGSTSFHMIQLALSSNSEIVHQDLILFNLENPKDYCVSSLSSLSINISRSFFFKISYQLKYSHKPVPGFKSTDQFY